MYADRQRIRKLLRRRENREKGEALTRQSVARASARRRSLPHVDFPCDLPISEHRERIVGLLKNHQVLVVCGETGSGKSTQLPKLCLQAGLGIRGLIAHTQPRRIAARTVAERISQELGSALGDAVGFRVRFSERISTDNYIRVMTDGMLLRELEKDPWLNRYEVLIVDEAHERSLNIDFLLGLAKPLLAKRPELRLVITSATLDSEKYSAHFDDAPVVEVSGRTYPVEMRYRPPEEPLNRDEKGLAEHVLSAIRELHDTAPGDVLVFLSGEREIRDVADHLGRRLKSGIELLPLYARLTPAEQHRIFRPGSKSRVILATNVAETSLTIPGIRYVVDSGLARISRYSPARKIQRLPVEKISRSSANQRAGRCGRTADGICIRLYEEEDFASRPHYTDPEILRMSLADVILRMKAMRLGDVDTFPFIDKPDRRQINDGIRHLVELGALDDGQRITRIGRSLGRIPVDPRIGRMLLAGNDLDCLNEVLVIAAALSIPDPRLAPSDQLQQARQRHRQLSEESSDFLALLDIWKQFRRIQKEQSRRKAWRWCEDNFLSVFRMREWSSLQASLLRLLKQDRFRLNSKPAEGERIHRALLTGLLSNVAILGKPVDTKSKRQQKAAVYQGTHGKQLKIFPGSYCYGQSPKWIMSSEIVETRELYARLVGPVQPQWIEDAGEHLLQLQYSEPHWDPKLERVVAFRRASMYGLPVYNGRRCDYGRINPQEARMIFIRSALVEGQLESRLPFFRHNAGLLAEVVTLENKMRRRDLLADDEVLFDFYDQRIPDDICSASDLRKWHRNLDENQRHRLKMDRSMLIVGEGMAQLDREYPDELDHRGIHLPLTYRFDPGRTHDGVTARVKLPLLNQLNAAVFDQLVPGMLREKLVLLLKSLPKVKRRNLVPIPDTVDTILPAVRGDTRPITAALAAVLVEQTGLDISAADFQPAQLPSYLNMKLELVDDKGDSIAVGDDLGRLQQQFGENAHQSFVRRGRTSLQRQGLTSWDFEELPQTVEVQIGDYVTDAWPALVDEGETVSIAVFDTRDEADLNHREGVRNLLERTLPQQRKLARRPLPEWQKISLMYAGIGDLQQLQHSMFHRAQDRVFFSEGEVVRTRIAFEKLVREKAPQLPGILVETASAVAGALEAYREVRHCLAQWAGELAGTTVADVEQQLEWLVYDGFVDDIPAQWLLQLPRYLGAITVRLEQARLDATTDSRRQHKLSAYWERFLQADMDYSDELELYRWMVEEYRVSIFAQRLGTHIRVSPARLDSLWTQLQEMQKRRVNPDP